MQALSDVDLTKPPPAGSSLDVDEYEGRWRVSGAVAKTGQARWVPVPPVLLQAVVDALPREDRDLTASPFAGFTADRLRTAIGRACKATGTPVFSPHDLRHRRATLWHLGGVPASEAAAWLGHSAQEHLRTYAHVMLDRTELEYAALLETRSPSTALPELRTRTRA
jgi:integrase